MSQEHYGRRTAEILAKNRNSALTPQEFEVVAREHESWLRDRTRANTLGLWKEYIKPTIVDCKAQQRLQQNRAGVSRVPRIVEPPPPASAITAPSLDESLTAGPCFLQTFQWPIPPFEMLPLNAGDPVTVAPDNLPQNTSWVTAYQSADPRSGVLLVGAAGGQVQLAGIEGPPTLRFNTETLNEIEESIAIASLSGIFRVPLGTRLTVYARLLVTLDPPDLPGQARPDTAVTFFNRLEAPAFMYASAFADLTIGTFDVNRNFGFHQFSIPIFTGTFTIGIVDPLDPPTIFFVGREFWLAQTIQLPPPEPLPNSPLTSCFVSISLKADAWATPVDDRFEHMAVIDLRGLPVPEFLGAPAILGTLSCSNPYKIRLAELRLLACGRNPLTF